MISLSLSLSVSDVMLGISSWQTGLCVGILKIEIYTIYVRTPTIFIIARIILGLVCMRKFNKNKKTEAKNVWDVWKVISKVN